MNKAQRADALLSMAELWQNGRRWCGSTDYHKCHRLHGDEVLAMVDELLDIPGAVEDERSSAALSEASALGYELENADGSPTEKVASFEPVGYIRWTDGDWKHVYKRTVQP